MARNATLCRDFKSIWSKHSNIVCQQYQSEWSNYTLQESYIESFTMLLSSDWPFRSEFVLDFDSWIKTEKVLAYLFAFVIGILLLNVLIAVVNNNFNGVVLNSKSSFWHTRMNIVQDVDLMLLFLSRYQCFSAKNEKATNPRISFSCDSGYSNTKKNYGSIGLWWFGYNNRSKAPLFINEWFSSGRMPLGMKF
jgi:hypothetical protein